jgi:hypothetical protein
VATKISVDVPKLMGGRDGPREVEEFLRQVKDVVNGLSVGGGAAAGTGLSYVTSKSEATLTGEQSLGLLTTGLLKNTVAAGVGTLSAAVAGTDYLTGSGTSGQVVLWGAGNAETGSASLTFSGHTLTVGDPANPGAGGTVSFNGEGLIEETYIAPFSTLRVLGQDRWVAGVGGSAAPFYSLEIDNSGNTLLTSIGTNDGTLTHPYPAIQQISGSPTGVPNVQAGGAAMIYQRDLHRLNLYENQGGDQGWHWLPASDGSGNLAIQMDASAIASIKDENGDEWWYVDGTGKTVWFGDFQDINFPNGAVMNIHAGASPGIDFIMGDSSATTRQVASFGATAFTLNYLLDLSAISAGAPNVKITATSDTPVVVFNAGGKAPTTAPAGYLEIDVGGSSRYIPFWA